MNPSQVIDEAKVKLETAKEHFFDELKKLRTGRAHSSIVDGVMVTAYGQPMPLKQVANVTAPEPQLLQITPFDPSNIQAINDAIRSDQSLGLNPSDDGRVVRVPIPPLTTERRQQIVKQMHEKVEEYHITSRNIRHEVLSTLKEAKNDKDIGEDEYTRLEKQVDELMSKAKSDVEAAAKSKEQEILTI
jgi:ribosome recycling factor